MITQRLPGGGARISTLRLRLPLPPQIHGAEICAWQQSETCLVPLLFAENCAVKGCAGQGRPAPRVAIVAERSWGSATSPADLLERIGCGYS